MIQFVGNSTSSDKFKKRMIYQYRTVPHIIAKALLQFAQCFAVLFEHFQLDESSKVHVRKGRRLVECNWCDAF